MASHSRAARISSAAASARPFDEVSSSAASTGVVTVRDVIDASRAAWPRAPGEGGEGDVDEEQSEGEEAVVVLLVVVGAREGHEGIGRDIEVGVGAVRGLVVVGVRDVVEELAVERDEAVVST